MKLPKTSDMFFDGKTYEPDKDKIRLGNQAYVVFCVMSQNPHWWTLNELALKTMFPESSISARLRDFRKQRIRLLRDLAAQGYRAQQIASKTGNGVGFIRKIAADENIHLSDKHIASKRIDPNRIINETVSTLAGCALGIQQINDLEKLDMNEISGWIGSLNISLKSISELIKKLKELS